MDAVSNLIFNALAQYEGIRLPGVGSLSVVRIPALIDEQGKIVPPNNKVVYLKEEPENFTSIIDLIEHSVGDKEKAEELYKKWGDKIHDEAGGISIEKTGGIKHDIFTVYPELEAILNPDRADFASAPETPALSSIPASAEQVFTKPMLAESVTATPVLAEPIPTKPESTKVKVNTNTVMTWIVVGVLLGAGIVFGLIYMRGQNHKIYRWRSNVATTTAVTTDKNAIPPTTTPTPTQTLPPADSVKHESSSSVSAIPHADEALQGPQVQGSQASQNATASALAKGRTVYYVVAGVFSVDQNAEKFIAQSKAKGSTVQFAKIEWKGKVIVSAYTSSSRTDAEQMRKKLSSELGELWIHQETGQ